MPSRVKNRLGTYLWREKYIEKVFSRIYKKNDWRNSETRSGACSTHAKTAAMRKQLPAFLADLNIKSILDAPCGDFHWMRLVDLGVEKYIGVDIVADLVAHNRRMYGSPVREFRVLDITTDELPAVDLILCRDCLIHLSFELIHAAIANFKKSGSQYLLTTTHAEIPKNTDIVPGNCFMINLQLPPFNFPPPLKSIPEEPQNGRRLALWRLRDL
jgi:hypothetical protein